MCTARHSSVIQRELICKFVHLGYGRRSIKQTEAGQVSFRIVARSIWGNPGNKGQYIKRTLRAIRWQLHKRTQKTPQTLRLASGRWFRAYPDCVISSALQYARWPEFVELKYCRSRLNRGDILIDVGANVGHFSLLLSDIVDSEDILAFEPAPSAFRRLGENWELNDWTRKHLFNCAVGETEATVFMANENGPLTTNRVHVGERAGDIAVPIRSLDSFRHLWADRNIGLLKIDVEGYEPNVFAGSVATLSEDRPGLIMFESLGAAVNGRVAKYLHDADYVVFGLDQRGEPNFTNFADQNLFASPRELAGNLT